MSTAFIRAIVAVCFLHTGLTHAQGNVETHRQQVEHMAKCTAAELVQTPMPNTTVRTSTLRWTGECVDGWRYGQGELVVRSQVVNPTLKLNFETTTTLQASFAKGKRVGVWCETKIEWPSGQLGSPAGTCYLPAGVGFNFARYLRMADGRWQPVSLDTSGGLAQSAWRPIPGESVLPAGTLEAQGQAAFEVAMGRQAASSGAVTELTGLEDLMPGKKITQQLNKKLKSRDGKPLGIVFSTRTLEAVERMERERLAFIQSSSHLPSFHERQEFLLKGSMKGFGAQLMKQVRSVAGSIDVLGDLAELQDKALPIAILVDVDMYVRYDMLASFHALPISDIGATKGRESSVCEFEVRLYVIDSDFTLVRKVVNPRYSTGRDLLSADMKGPAGYFWALNMCATGIWNSGLPEQAPIGMVVIQELLRSALAE